VRGIRNRLDAGVSLGSATSEGPHVSCSSKIVTAGGMTVN
jgi:hypothetical protein